VDSFKLETGVVTIDYLHVEPGKRYYIVAYGVQGSEATPPTAKVIAVNRPGSSGSKIISSLVPILVLLILTLM